MCGICGIVGPGNSLQVRLMQQALRHRGPNGEGNTTSSQVNLAMRRLAIIDVAGGDQPLYNEDKSIEIVGNGEIYNYVELAKELKSKRHKLRTGSDIETVVHLYEDLGIKCVTKLRGMFALTLHDKIKHKVYLIRDRMGEKPLYYTFTKSGLVFASEMKALLQVRGIDKTLNHNSLDQFFHFYYIIEPATAFRHIHKLPAGNYLEIDIPTGETKLTKYWDAAQIQPTMDSNPTRRIKDEFAYACEIAMRSDVPVGISLSGGIDSGSILALCAPKYKAAMKAFSVGYAGTPPSDERQMAKDLAAKFKVEFFETEITTKDIVDFFPRLVWAADDPIADIASHSIYAVSHLARQHKVPVLLGGLGGDELFWGYPATNTATAANIASLSSWWPRRQFRYANPDPASTGKFITQLYTHQFRQQLNPPNLLRWPKITVELEMAKHSLDLLRDWWLTSNCIVLGDRLSMASSIELRSPFLDYKLVETVLTSKLAVLAYKQPPKYWFKKAMAEILPDEVLNRPKQGFTPPVTDWLRGILAKYLPLTKNGFLAEQKILDANKLKLAVAAWQTLPMYWYDLYQIVLLEIWGREFVWDIPASEL